MPDNGNTGIDICGSVSLPISAIDSKSSGHDSKIGFCYSVKSWAKHMAIETAEWEYQVQKHRQKMIHNWSIEGQCRELEVNGIS